MNLEKIKAAELEARRFLERVQALKADCKGKKDDDWITGRPALTGALRRSSLDLTRSLAAMRKAW